jgi:fucose permease
MTLSAFARIQDSFSGLFLRILSRDSFSGFFLRTLSMTQTRKRDYFVVVVTFLTFLAGLGLVDGAIGVGWEFIREEFGRDAQALAPILLLTMLGFLPSSFLSGPLAARFGSGPMIVGGVTLVGVGMIGFALAPVWEILLLAAFARGIGAGVIDAGLNAYVATHYNARIMNWLHACFGIGVTISPTVMTLIVAEWNMSWRVGFIWLALAQGVLIALLLISLKWWVKSDPSTEPDPTNSRQHQPLMATLRLPIVYVAVLFMFVYVGIELSVGNWTFKLFNEARGVPELTAGYLVSLYWGSLTIGRILFGFLPQNLSRTTTLRATISLTILGALLFWWNPVNWVSYVGLFLLGFAQAPIFATFVGGIPQWVGAGHANNAIGFQLSAASLGASLVPSFVGVLVATEQFTLEVIGPYMFTLAVMLFVLHEVSVRMGQRTQVMAAPVPQTDHLTG